MKIRSGCLVTCIFVFLSAGFVHAQQKIFDIAYDGDAETLRSVQGRVDDYTVKTGEGDSLLIVCLKGYIVRKRSGAGTTPLHIAASNGDEETAALLLDKGADPHVWDEQGETPVMRALNNGHTALARSLRNRITDTPSGRVTQKYVSTASLLIQNGAPVNTYDRSGKSALMYAVETGSADLVRVLVESGAEVSYRMHPYGKSALHMAVERGDTSMVGVLLRSRGEVNAPWKPADQRENETVEDNQPPDDRYARPTDHNLRIVVYSDRSDPESDRRCYYKIYIDKVEAGRTVTGLESQKKLFTAKVEPNRHLIQLEKYVLDEKKEKYVKLNNIYQPRPGHFYSDIHPQRILEIRVRHVTDGVSEYAAEYVKE